MSITTQKSKLDMLAEQEARLTEEVEAARSRISEYPALLHDARSRAIYAKPNVRPGAELNSEVSKLNAKEKKDLASLRSLEQDLSAICSVLAVEAQHEAERETEAARAQLAELHRREEEIWGDAGKLLGELATVWNAYTELAEQESRVAQESGLDGSGALAVTPAPLSFKAWLLLLHRAATDPEVRAEPYQEQLIDAGLFGNRDSDGNALPGVVYDVRPAGTREVDVRKKLDYGDRLHDLIPDLTPVVRALQLSGNVPTSEG
jgi:hypothetical protein